MTNKSKEASCHAKWEHERGLLEVQAKRNEVKTKLKRKFKNVHVKQSEVEKIAYKKKKEEVVLCELAKDRSNLAIPTAPSDKCDEETRRIIFEQNETEQIRMNIKNLELPAEKKKQKKKK